MKEQIRTLLLQNPGITLPEAARTLGKDPQNNKSFGLAYWQARTLLMEELTGQTIRTLLENTDRKDRIINTDLIKEEHNTDRIDNEGHTDDMDHMNEGPNTNMSLEDIDQVFGAYDISDF